jgi:hypothetical protein
LKQSEAPSLVRRQKKKERWLFWYLTRFKKVFQFSSRIKRINLKPFLNKTPIRDNIVSVIYVFWMIQIWIEENFSGVLGYLKWDFQRLFSQISDIQTKSFRVESFDQKFIGESEQVSVQSVFLKFSRYSLHCCIKLWMEFY